MSLDREPYTVPLKTKIKFFIRQLIKKYSFLILFSLLTTCALFFFTSYLLYGGEPNNTQFWFSQIILVIIFLVTGIYEKAVVLIGKAFGWLIILMMLGGVVVDYWLNKWMNKNNSGIITIRYGFFTIVFIFLTCVGVVSFFRAFQFLCTKVINEAFPKEKRTSFIKKTIPEVTKILALLLSCFSFITSVYGVIVLLRSIVSFR